MPQIGVQSLFYYCSLQAFNLLYPGAMILMTEMEVHRQRISNQDFRPWQDPSLSAPKNGISWNSPLRISVRGRTRHFPRRQEIAPLLCGVHIREDSQELDSLSACPGAGERFGEHNFGTPRNPFKQRRLRLPQADQPITPVRRRPHYQIERPQLAPGFANVGRGDLRAVGAD